MNKDVFRDPHLEFFWKKCDMCKVHYDVIGKVETSQEDINYVSHKVHTEYIKLNSISNRVIYQGLLPTKPLEDREFQFVYLYSLLSNTQFIT